MTKGRKPTPSKLKQLRGRPDHRPINADEPEYELVLPPPPVDLTEIGKSKWDELSLLFYNQRILTAADLDMLHLFCQEYELYVETYAAMKKEGGVVVKTDKGNPIQNPYLSVANQCKERMMKIMIEFGMSPSSRSRIKVTASPPAPKDKQRSLANKFFRAKNAK